jgi:hypothetical protein
MSCIRLGMVGRLGMGPLRSRRTMKAIMAAVEAGGGASEMRRDMCVTISVRLRRSRSARYWGVSISRSSSRGVEAMAGVVRAGR